MPVVPASNGVALHMRHCSSTAVRGISSFATPKLMYEHILDITDGKVDGQGCVRNFVGTVEDMRPENLVVMSKGLRARVYVVLVVSICIMVDR